MSAKRSSRSWNGSTASISCPFCSRTGFLAPSPTAQVRRAARSSTSKTPSRSAGRAVTNRNSLYNYAKALLDTGSRDDRVKAATLLHDGYELSSGLGMGTLSAAIAAFRQRYGLRLARKPVGLTSRELEILGLLSVGKTNKEIADALCISSNTVAVHVARVLSKTGSSNRTEAASYAVRHHLTGETPA